MSDLDQSNNFLHASLAYYTGDLPTSIVSGHRFSEKEKRCLNNDLHSLKWKAEELHLHDKIRITHGQVYVSRDSITLYSCVSWFKKAYA
jgi:hypothetical protein